jgi:hypothetical protein
MVGGTPGSKRSLLPMMSSGDGNIDPEAQAIVQACKLGKTEPACRRHNPHGRKQAAHKRRLLKLSTVQPTVQSQLHTVLLPLAVAGGAPNTRAHVAAVAQMCQRHTEGGCMLSVCQLCVMAPFCQPWSYCHVYCSIPKPT